MTPAPCPACKGRCCRDQDYGHRRTHMAAEFYEHDCPACEDGSKYVPLPTYEDGIAEGERRATAAVVAYLRSFYLRSFGDICADMADNIERGEHRREESKP